MKVLRINFVRLSIISILWSGCQNTFSQQNEVKKETIVTNGTVGKNAYVTGRYRDNWSISFGIGGSVYGGPNFSHGSLSNRIGPMVNLSLNKWITPHVGLRGQAGWARFNSYAGKGNAYTYGMPDASGFYKQKWNSLNVHADVLWNFSSTVAGYNPKRIYEAIPFIGVGGMVAATSPNKKCMLFTAGLINKFRISDVVDINVELKGGAFNQRFDSQKRRDLQGYAGATVGFTYKFGKKQNRGFKRVTNAPIV